MILKIQEFQNFSKTEFFSNFMKITVDTKKIKMIIQNLQPKTRFTVRALGLTDGHLIRMRDYRDTNHREDAPHFTQGPYGVMSFLADFETSL